MDNLIDRCTAHIQFIINQLYADLDASQDDERTAKLRAALKHLEDTLHQLNK